MTRNGLSVDLEDWFSLVRRRVWGVQTPPTERLVVATHRLLDVLDAARTRATFFVLGEVAEAFPALVRELVDRGHQLGTHGHHHRRVDEIGADAFREELRRSVNAITNVAGVRPLGHRAPEFSISTATPWAFDILAEEGFTFDSSVFPISHPRYGIAGASRTPYWIRPTLRELPLATFAVAGRRIPAAGGGYLRYFPYTVIDRAVRQANRSGEPAIIYVHPYEFDPQPLGFSEPLPNARARLFVTMQNIFRGRSPKNLSRLLRQHEFVPLGELV